VGTRFGGTLIDLGAFLVVALVAEAALTGVPGDTSSFVFTVGVRVAFERLFCTFVDIFAGLAIASEASVALAFEAAIKVCALCVRGAVVLLLFALVNVLARLPCASETRVAGTLVTPRCVRALGVLVAVVFDHLVGALINLHTGRAVAAVAWFAFTRVRAGGVGTQRIGVAGVFNQLIGTLIDLQTGKLALQTVPSGALALVATSRVLADRVGTAFVRPIVAFVDIFVAQTSHRGRPAICTLARPAFWRHKFRHIDAFALVLAINAFTLAGVLCCLTVRAKEAAFAFAFRLADEVFARTSVLALVRFTLVNVGACNSGALVAGLALAFEGAGNVGAGSLGVTVVGFFLAFVDLLAAVVASVSRSACTVEGAREIVARRIVQTWGHGSQTLVCVLADRELTQEVVATVVAFFDEAGAAAAITRYQIAIITPFLGRADAIPANMFWLHVWNVYLEAAIDQVGDAADVG